MKNTKYGIAGEGREYESNPDPRTNPAVAEQIRKAVMGSGKAPSEAKRGYWRQNTYEGHSHSYTLVVDQFVKDFPTYGKLCAYCKANNITAQLA
jgi:hypothetical protein